MSVLLTESANKKRVLCWVWQVCPSLQHVTDLSSQWCDGIALCVLLNAVVPGTCPRHDLLRPDHSVNNCRLAVRLVQRNLGIRQVRVRVTPGERYMFHFPQNCVRAQFQRAA